MEMHQIRYFQTVARTLNFTRAANQCNVSQPALTRAIRQLEEELGGQLLRREGKLSHLTELGERMVPLMQQCYEGAMAAKSLASSFKKGAAHSLSLALSHSVSLRLLASGLAELQRALPGLQIKVMRGTAGELSESLQKGRVDFAIAGPLGQSWDRLDRWPLFEEKFELVAHPANPIREGSADVRKLAEQQLLVSTQCESAEALGRVLEEHGIAVHRSHQVGPTHDVVGLLRANLGVAFLPQSAIPCKDLTRVPVPGLEMSREVSLYGVAGRERSAAADAVMKLLRARNWSKELGRAA
jgi:DNA-binding transcriptional LysR family regulator